GTARLDGPLARPALRDRRSDGDADDAGAVPPDSPSALCELLAPRIRLPARLREHSRFAALAAPAGRHSAPHPSRGGAHARALRRRVRSLRARNGPLGAGRLLNDFAEPHQSGSPSRRASAWNACWSRRVIGPGEPSPIRRPSTSVTAITSAPVPE